MKLTKKIVIIGATSGIAEHCARQWSEKFTCYFFLVARDQEKLQKIKQDLEIRNPASVIICKSLDFLDTDDIINLADTIFSQDTIDIVLIAQGWLADQLHCQQDLSLLKESLSVNALSPTLCAEAFVRHLEKAGQGTLAVIGSVAGERGKKSNYVYGAAKGLIDRYIQGLQHRFAKSNLHIILIKPGPTDTAMTAHMKNTGFASAAQVAKDIVVGIESGKPVIYTPAKWKWIMLIVRFIPDFIFHKLTI